MDTHRKDECTFSTEVMVHGYHVHEDVWEAALCIKGSFVTGHVASR